MYDETASIVAAASGWAEFLAAPDRVTLAVVCLVLAVLAGVLFWVLLVARRRVAADVRQVVLALEELRSGDAPLRHGELDAGSPLVLVRDAVQRLGQDVAARIRQAEEAEHKLRAMGDAAVDSAIIQTDVDGDIVEFSAGAVQLFGWSRDEVLGRPSAMLFDEQAYKDFLPKLLRRSIRETGLDTRTVMAHRDGEKFTGELHVRGVRAEGAGGGFLFVIRDASEHARLEEGLREAEQRYRGLVEGLDDGVMIVHAGKVLYANPAMAALAGVPVDRIIGEPLRRRIATRDLLNVEERLAAIERGENEEASFKLEVRLATETGPGPHVRLDARAADYLGSRAILLVARDQTIERRIHAELQRNESRLDAVLEATSDGILVLAETGDGQAAQMTNRAFLELFGLRQEEVLGRREGALLRTCREHGGGSAGLARLLEAAEEGPYGERLTLGGSHPREIRIQVSPLSDGTGAVWGRVVACRDESERVSAERKLQQFAEQLQLKQVLLEHAYKRLQEEHSESDRLNDELRKLDEMKSNLLGNVSHELQAPLVSIRGYTELLEKERFGPVSEQQRNILRLALRNIDRLIGLIDNLLAFTRTEPEMARLELGDFDLGALVTEVETLLRGSFVEKELAVNLGVPTLTVHADRNKIGQVLINLLTNAVKFTGRGGEISVQAHPANGDYVEVEIADSGVGIPEHLRDRIFERGFQIDREGGPRDDGSGIGLSIVRDILRLHGCRIGVESKPGKGSRFYFTLPAAERAAGRAPVETDTRPSPQPEAAHRPVVPNASEHDLAGGSQAPAGAKDDLVEKIEQEIGEAVDPGSDDDDEPPRPRFRIIRR